MLQVMNSVTRSECSAKWKRSLLVLLQNDCDNEEVENYRFLP